MEPRVNATSEKLARAQAALKSGLLGRYVQTKSADTGKKTAMSWGPMMRK